MLTAARATTQAANTGKPMPTPDWMRALVDLMGTAPKLGQVTMIAGMPGSMKSLFAHCWLADSGLRTLCFSADQDANETITRLAAHATGQTRKSVEAAFALGQDGFYRQQLQQYPIVFDFEAAPSLDSIEESINAYVEAWDAWPEALIVDSLYSVYPDQDDDSEHRSMESVLHYLQEIARATGAAVIVCHHLSESAKGGPEVPGPRASIIGKVNRIPETILTVAFASGEGLFRVAPVKVRGGKADPSGAMYATLGVSPETSTFTHYNAMTAGFWQKEVS
jgi:hypothetical protein